MAMNLDAMLRIKADVQGENSIRRLGNSMQGLQGQAKNAALGFNNLKTAVAGFGAAIAGSAVVAGLTAVVKTAINAGDELFNLQAKTGVAANALIAIGNAAKLADVDMGTLAKGLTKLNVNLVKAAEGNEDLSRKFQALGVSVKGADGQVVSSDKALKQIADRFADMPDGAQKAAAAVAIFGKSGAELIPLLNEGSAAMEEFTFRVGEDFAARSDLFNDTITELGIKTQGFGLELTDALLPALQSILEVFGDLFDTKNDFDVLFEVIKGGLRAIATALYATIKLVDQFLKAWGATFDALNKAMQGDFAGAGRALYQGLTQGIDQARRDFQQIEKIWTDSASPGTGRRTGGRAMDLDTTDADRRAAANAKRAAAEAKRAANEQERLAERRSTLTQRAIALQEQLRQSVEDANAAYKGVGANAVEGLLLQRNAATTENNRTIDKLTLDVVELARAVKEAGGDLDVEPFRQLINTLSQSRETLADSQLTQGLKDLLPSLDDYNQRIAEAKLIEENRKVGIEGLTEAQKLQLQVQLLGLEALAATNEELRKYLEQLKQAAANLDKVQQKQKTTFGEDFRKTLQDAYKSATDLGSALGNTAVRGIDGLTDAIVDFASTGKAAFQDLAATALKELGSIFIKYALFKTLFSVFPGLNIGLAATGGATGPNSAAPLKAFANGGIMSANGVVPLKRYAQGGIARSPQMALYGERGPEAYVPLPDGRNIPVKVQQRNDVLDRYRPMGATGTVTNDGDMAAAAGGAVAAGGAIDVRYTVERINNVEYVTAEQFQQGLQRAAREGAARGEQQTLRRLQTSASTRRKVGV
jgi:hypothetical protein